MKILYCNKDLIKYHIAEALVMSGLPMSTDTDNLEKDIWTAEKIIFGHNYTEFIGPTQNAERHFDRAKKLDTAKAGSGHDCFLKACVVTAIISAPSYQWPQIQRYHFLDIASSQSKMHRITKMDLIQQCNDEVNYDIIHVLNNYISCYNNAQTEHVKEVYFRKIINNCPMGLQLAAGIVTNYLQLKTMKAQRKHHKLHEWSHDFVEWVDGLPYFVELTEGK